MGGAEGAESGARMTSDQIERKRAKQRECMRRLRAQMTPEQLAAKREAGREYMRRTRIESPEVARAAERRYREAHREELAYRSFCRDENNRDAANRRKADWKKANPERHRQLNRESAKRCAARPENKAAERTRSRARYVQAVKDKAALGLRVTNAAQAVVPRNLPAHIRCGVLALLIERIYSGELPIRITAEHGKAALADYRRDVERFALQHVSLDAPVGQDGASFGQMVGVY